MGMSICLLAVEAEKASSLLKDSSDFQNWLFSEEVEDSSDLLDLDKSWDGLRYLLKNYSSNKETHLDQAIIGGKPFGDDMGMGPARMIAPQDVKIIAESLAKVTHEDLKKEFDPDDMTAQDIYPAIWDRTDEMEEEFKGYLMPNFDALKEHYIKAAQEGKAMVLYLT